MAQQHDSPTQPLPLLSPKTTLPTAPRATSTGQTVATVILLLHLFCLFIGVISNVGLLSPIRQALRNVPLVPDYLQLLSMDRGYDYPLTLGAPEEGSYQLQLTSQAKESDSMIIQLPDTTTAPRIRRQRYENLAMRMADLVTVYEGDPHHQTLLSEGIGSRLLRELNLPAGTYQLHVQRQTAQRLEGVTLGLAPEAPSMLVGINLLVDLTGELQLALQEKENLTATVRQAPRQGAIQQEKNQSNSAIQ